MISKSSKRVFGTGTLHDFNDLGKIDVAKYLKRKNKIFLVK